MTPEQLRALKEAIEAIEVHADAVPDNAKVGLDQSTDAGIHRVLSTTDRIEMQRRLKKLSQHELLALLGEQMHKQGQGIGVDQYLRAGGRAAIDAMSQNPTLTKALDTSGATALIRQDLEPLLYELYIREFPAWDRFAKEPANGLVHAYDRQTTFGDAQFMSELGTVTDDTSAYERATTPVSVLATRRGVSLKAQYGTLAGGAGFNPEQLEMRGGLRAMAHKMQKTIFQGNATATGGTSASEDGALDTLAFDGMRRTLNTARAKNVDPTAATPEDIRAAINDAMIETVELAGRPNVIFIDAEAKGQFDKQQDANVHYNQPGSLTSVAVGVVTNVVNTTMGPLPLFWVPGDSIGEYVHSTGTVSDAYMIDESAISLPYLGSDGIQVLEIPMGISGQLTRLFILFGMWGLAFKSVQFHNKVRIKREA